MLSLRRKRYSKITKEAICSKEQMASFTVETTINYVGGAEKALAMQRTKNTKRRIFKSEQQESFSTHKLELQIPYSIAPKLYKL